MDLCGSALELISPRIACLQINGCPQLLALADEWLREPAEKVSGVIADGSGYGKLIEKNTLKNGRMAFLPEQPDDDRVRTLYAFILDRCVDYICRMQGPQGPPPSPADIELERCWIVDQRSHDYQVLHAHIPNLLSGIIYLAVPSCMKASTYPDGVLTLLDNNPFVILPMAGDMYIWPSYMLHNVYPFRGEGRRVAISFNARPSNPARSANVYFTPTYRQVSRQQYYGGR